MAWKYGRITDGDDTSLLVNMESMVLARGLIDRRLVSFWVAVQLFMEKPIFGRHRQFSPIVIL